MVEKAVGKNHNGQDFVLCPCGSKYKIRLRGDEDSFIGPQFHLQLYVPGTVGDLEKVAGLAVYHRFAQCHWQIIRSRTLKGFHKTRFKFAVKQGIYLDVFKGVDLNQFFFVLQYLVQEFDCRLP